MAQVFTETDRQEMLVASYAVGEIADLVDFMPGNETPEAVGAILGDLSPADPPPPKADWSPESVQYGVGYGASYYAHLHMTFGAEAVEKEREYYESAR